MQRRVLGRVRVARLAWVLAGLAGIPHARAQDAAPSQAPASTPASVEARGSAREQNQAKNEAQTAPATRSNQSSVGPLRVYAGLRLGVGGNYRIDTSNRNLVSDNLKMTVGTQAGVDYLLMKYFALGGEFRVGWWNTTSADQAGFKRGYLIDIDVKPRGLYMFEKVPVELYGTIPLGLTIPKTPGYYHVDARPGFNVGFGAGATWFFKRHWGLNVEGTGIFHEFRSNLKVGPHAWSMLAQFDMFANVVYAL